MKEFYSKGKYNVVVDSLNRRSRMFPLVPLKFNLRETMLGKCFGDSWYLNDTSVFQSGRKSKLKFEGRDLETDGLLQFKGRMHIP